MTETLAKEAERHEADILVVGATGLKIEEGAVHADSYSVMGSVSDGARASRPRALPSTNRRTKRSRSRVVPRGFTFNNAARDDSLTASILRRSPSGSLHRSDVSVAIVKPTSYALERGGAMRYVLATDDSPSSRLAFALLVDKLADAKDTLHVYANRDGQSRC